MTPDMDVIEKILGSDKVNNLGIIMSHAPNQIRALLAENTRLRKVAEHAADWNMVHPTRAAYLRGVGMKHSSYKTKYSKLEQEYLAYLNGRIKSLKILMRVAKTLELKFINKGRLEEAIQLKDIYKDFVSLGGRKARN